MWITRLFVGSQSLFVALALLSVAADAQGQSHAMIDRNRSSWQNNFFLTQNIEGEYGRFTKSDSEQSAPVKQSWHGYGVRNGMGIEVLKFVQFSLSHTMFSLRSKETTLENAQGSRLGAEVSLVFSAPLANIQFSGGLTAADLDYQSLDRSASYAGTGRYLGVGVNYFFNPRLSLQLSAKRADAEFKKNGGNLSVHSLKAKTEQFSLGLAVWL